jgi:CARDB
MLKRLITIISLAVALGCSGLLAKAQSHSVAKARTNAAQPDLEIKQFLFPPANDKALRVNVANTGAAPSGLCVLRLTVRKINGIAVGRVTEVKLPPLAPGTNKWVVVNAKSILPSNVSLDSTTFKLNADATQIIAETNEGNNEMWHNL